MTHTQPRLRLAPHPALLMALALLTGCITADGTLRQDGSGTLTISFPTTATVAEDKPARALVTAQDVTIESLVIADAGPGERGPRRATAKLSAKNVAAFEKLALLGVIGTTIVHKPTPDGGGSFTLKLQNARPTPKDDPAVARMMQFPATVRLHMPGPVLETTGTQKDGVVEWTFPAGDWSIGKSLRLTVAYGPGAAGEKPATSGTGNGKAS